MIDQTSVRIERAQAETLKRRARREAFEKMLKVSDTVLWRLEEMNRDGVVALSIQSQRDIVKRLRIMPERIRGLYCADGTVQGALDSLFAIQEALFRVRNPELDYDEEEIDQE
jgi:hypothetical protein